MSDENINKLLTELFGKTRQQAHLERVCIRCSREIDIDSLSQDEHGGYVLSALCPDCYDEVRNRSVENAIAALDALRGGRYLGSSLPLAEPAEGSVGEPDVQPE